MEYFQRNRYSFTFVCFNLLTICLQLKYLTTLEGDTLVTKDLNEPSAIVTRKFTDDGLCMVKL